MRKFEIVSKYKNENIELPSRATSHSAGYDLAAAKDTFVPSLLKSISLYKDDGIYEIAEHAALIKSNGYKATMVPTGVKVMINDNEELEIRSRSSISTKNLLILANGVGTIDAKGEKNYDFEMPYMW